VVSDVRLVASLVDRVYAGMLMHVALREIRDMTRVGRRPRGFSACGGWRRTGSG
jgi:hypothetical protein